MRDPDQPKSLLLSHESIPPLAALIAVTNLQRSEIAIQKQTARLVQRCRCRRDPLMLVKLGDNLNDLRQGRNVVEKLQNGRRVEVGLIQVGQFHAQRAFLFIGG